MVEQEQTDVTTRVENQTTREVRTPQVVDEDVQEDSGVEARPQPESQPQPSETVTTTTTTNGPSSSE